MAVEVLGEVFDVVLDCLELAFEGSNKKNSKKSTKPGCLIWLLVLIIICLIWIGYNFIMK